MIVEISRGTWDIIEAEETCRIFAFRIVSLLSHLSLITECDIKESYLQTKFCSSLEIYYSQVIGLISFN